MPTKLPTVHMVVKNEDIFIWYAIASVINFASELIIFDTASEDNTVKIIKSFDSPKIKFTQKGKVNSRELVELRQEQIDETNTDWFWVVDGDEVYSQITCQEIIDYIKKGSNRYEGGVVRRYDLMGDIYHFQKESVGEYNLFGQRGHLVLRLLNKKKLSKINITGTYPLEGYVDGNNIQIINHQKENFFITKNRLFHAMYLKRSSLGGNLANTLHRKKNKLEKGYRFSSAVKIPEVFFEKRPSFITDMKKPRSLLYEIMSALVTPIKNTKRYIGRYIS